MSYRHLAVAATAALLAGALCAPVLGHAQTYGQGGSVVGGGFAPPVTPRDTPGKQALPPGPALPGVANTAPVVPSDKLATDMSPDDALFDAINRGDMAGVRDALSRGADLNAQNVLGMTPTELSVDLGRNDITFLLLSERGADPGSFGPPPPKLAQGQGPGGKPLKAARAGRVVPAQFAGAVTAVRRARTPEPPAATVRYAGADPGAPVPQAGFLGFGGVATP